MAARVARFIRGLSSNHHSNAWVSNSKSSIIFRQGKPDRSQTGRLALVVFR